MGLARKLPGSRYPDPRWGHLVGMEGVIRDHITRLLLQISDVNYCSGLPLRD